MDPPKPHHSDHHIHNTQTRVYPLVKTLPFKLLHGTWDNPWETVPVADRPAQFNWAPGTVTCLVQLQDQADAIFMLSAGHAWYDMDPYSSKSTEEDRIANRTPNFLDLSWGEDDQREVQEFGPFAVPSDVPYFRMGDKMSSKLDAGLALVKPTVGWNNIYNINNIHGPGDDLFTPKVLRTLDMEWPPEFGNDPEFRCREVVVPSAEFVVCDAFESEFMTYNGKKGCTIQRVLLRKRPLKSTTHLGVTFGQVDPNGTTLTGGASGSALIKYTHRSNDAVVVGLFLGYSKAMVVPPGSGLQANVNYDIFQHVSVARDKFGLAVQLPQPK